MKSIYLICFLSLLSSLSFAAEPQTKGCVVILTDSEGLTSPNHEHKLGFGETVHHHIREAFPGFSVYSKMVGGSNVRSWSNPSRAQFEVTTLEGDGTPVNQKGYSETGGDQNIPIQSLEGQLSHCKSSGPKILILLAGANMLWDGKNGIQSNRAFLERIRKSGFSCTWIGPPQVRISKDPSPKAWREEYGRLAHTSPASSHYNQDLQAVVDSELHGQVDRPGGCHYLSSLRSVDYSKITGEGYHYPSTETNLWAQRMFPAIDADIERRINFHGAQTWANFESNPRVLASSADNYDANAAVNNGRAAKSPARPGQAPIGKDPIGDLLHDAH